MAERFRTFIFDIEELGEEDRLHARNLAEELRAHKIEVGFELQTEVIPQETVILTDREETILTYQKTEAAILGYEGGNRDGMHLQGPQIVILGLAEIDYEFVKRQYQRKHDLPWTILETKRCIVREITMEDLDELYELYRMPGITRYMEPLYERSKEEEYTRAYINNMYHYYGYGMWVIVQKSTQRVIGRAGFNEQVIEGVAETEMGYMIAADLQGQGYATEVCRAIMEYGREYHEFQKLNCLIEPENQASIALAESLGLKRQGRILLNGKGMEQFVIEF